MLKNFMQKDFLFNKKKICVIQARVDSLRLKKKIFLKLYKNQTSLEILIKKLKKIKFINKIIIASGSKNKNYIIKKKFNNKNIEFYFGSEKNVALRFYHICKNYKNSYIIRVTADNPLTEIKYIKFLMNKIKKTKYKFVMMNNFKIPYGSGVEIFDSDFYVKNYNKVINNYQKEHVYEHLKKNKLFKIFNPTSDNSCFPFRVTLDTKEDLIYLRYLMNSLDIKNIYDIEKRLINVKHEK